MKKNPLNGGHLINKAGEKQETESFRLRDRRVHMANERTFLAWIRTSIGIMAFGFVVERFALFTRQFAYILNRPGSPGSSPAFSPTGYSSILGVFLVGLGAMMAVLSFIRYRRVEKQITEDRYQPSALLDVLLTIAIVAVAGFLVLILLHSF